MGHLSNVAKFSFKTVFKADIKNKNNQNMKGVVYL